MVQPGLEHTGDADYDLKTKTKTTEREEFQVRRD